MELIVFNDFSCGITF